MEFGFNATVTAQASVNRGVITMSITTIHAFFFWFNSSRNVTLTRVNGLSYRSCCELRFLRISVEQWSREPFEISLSLFPGFHFQRRSTTGLDGSDYRLQLHTERRKAADGLHHAESLTTTYTGCPLAIIRITSTAHSLHAE